MKSGNIFLYSDIAYVADQSKLYSDLGRKIHLITRSLPHSAGSALDKISTYFHNYYVTSISKHSIVLMIHYLRFLNLSNEDILALPVITTDCSGLSLCTE